MVDQVLSLLSPGGHKVFLDGTVGGGGHTRAILEACPDCRVIAVDRDPEAVAEARAKLAEFGERVRLVHRGFDAVLDDPDIRDTRLDGALLDLGVSSHQLDEDARGFAFRRGVALDMRMDAGQGQTAADLLAEADEEQLTRVFRELGEEPRARRLAREVVKRRATEQLTTSDDLVAALVIALGRAPTAQDKAKIFAELESLKRALPMLRDALRGGGVFVVLAYHSLEDRMVKRAFREWSQSCVCPPDLPVCVCRGRPLGDTLTRRPIRPSDAEIAHNPRARSARLRAWRKAA
jgi:16S rRNA (cytosine1402-N4)-methyltransferase